MRYQDLAIQTHRQPPSGAHSPGQSLLIRAGYLSHSAEWLPLAAQTFQRIQTRHAQPGFVSALGITVQETPTDLYHPHPLGAEELALCPACGFASRLSLAPVKKTVHTLQAPSPLQEVLTPNCPTIESLATFLGIHPAQTAKAILLTRLADGQFIFAVIRGDQTLSLPKLTLALGQTRLATEAEIRAVGAVPGYASPIGVHNALIIVDDLIPTSPNLVAGANRAGYHLLHTNYGRDYTAHLVTDLTLAQPGDPCPHCAAPLQTPRGWVLLQNGEPDPAAILSALAENHQDEKGLRLPAGLAPFDVYLMHIPGKTADTLTPTRQLYRTLTEHGIPTLLDDREERPGVKFNDADLIGCPIRVTVGERGLQNGLVEVKRRTAADIEQAPMDTLVEALLEK